MSALRVRRDVEELDTRIGRVLARAARSGVALRAGGSPLGHALDALAACQRALHLLQNDRDRAETRPCVTSNPSDPMPGGDAEG